MLMFLVYMFAVLGMVLLLSAAVLQFKLSHPPASGQHKITHALSAFNLKFPQRFVTPDEAHLIALDDDGQTMAIGLLHPGKPEPVTATLYKFEAILGAEIVENALTLSKVSKTSRITTSAPRIRGGAAGDSQSAAEADSAAGSAEEIRELTLKIYLSSTDTPVLSIPFLPGLHPARKDDLVYSAAFLEAQQVHERIRDIVSA
ncbi:hypothetical protein [Paenibacillus sp. MMS20-IR301]|uniref:hypothetical protein n=1 Tax=Paenibacillus sp. MMS20-IR301 TaxID=2895946 RepID=UPI0028ED0BEA|nr:hypothetical protein [Paenibacillus sp. MMS20-IR301]WNS41156.1 hypothetical protein LOS79_19155 [Paenibacillus sp. MMS20-IR301]